MNTKRIKEWKLSNVAAQQMGVDDSFEKMADALIERDLRFFINKLNSTNINSPLLNALNTCFGEVESEFNSDRWVKFDGEIYFDKQAKGFWMLSEEKIKSFNDGQFFPSGQSYYEVKEKVNLILQDKFNKWDIPEHYVLKKLTGLSHTPFRIQEGRFVVSMYYLRKKKKHGASIFLQRKRYAKS